MSQPELVLKALIMGLEVELGDHIYKLSKNTNGAELVEKVWWDKEVGTLMWNKAHLGFAEFLMMCWRTATLEQMSKIEVAIMIKLKEGN